MQFNNISLNLLLKNPILDTYSDELFIEDSYISTILNYKLKIQSPENKPFVFSCFALSVDGQLYYPDLPSGYNIAKCNYHASPSEQDADFFILALARSISEVVIVGVNSLNNESGNFLPEVFVPELKNLRHDKYQSDLPITLVMCRNLDNIDFKHTLFSDNNSQVIICCTDNFVNLDKLPASFNILNEKNWASKSELSLKNVIINVDLESIIKKLYQVGFKILLNESPYSHHQLLESQLLSELWLNYSGSYIGGNNGLGSLQQSFNSIKHPDCEILTLHSLGYNFLYTRQKILYKN